MAIEVPTLASETIGHIGAFEVRNTMIMAWLAMAVLTVIALTLKAKGYQRVPGRFQALCEMVIEGLFDFFNTIMLDSKQTRKVFPLVASIFIFIVISNWMGILPGVGSITIEGVHEGHTLALPLLRSMNADVNMTFAFAAIAMLAVQVFGFAALGLRGYAGKFIVMPWVKPYCIGTVVGLLELMGEFSRSISFTFRLFGNIFAGEVLLVVIGFLMPYIAPVPFFGLEIFVGLVQGLVFAMLTLVFLKMAMTPHAHEEHEHSHAQGISS